MDTSRVKIMNNCLHLPTGQPVPNDAPRLGLLALLTTDSSLRPFGETRCPTRQVTVSRSFRTLLSRWLHTSQRPMLTRIQAATMTLYYMFEKFSRPRRTRGPQEHRLRLPSHDSHWYFVYPCDHTPTAAPRSPRYWYQVGAEDQALTEQVSLRPTDLEGAR